MAPPAPQRSPEISAAVAYALQQFVNALALAAIYALLATAYALIYGLIGRLNLAFGELAVVGAYGAIGGVTAAVALGLDDPIGGLALALVHRRRALGPVELGSSAASWSRRCMRAIASASRSWSRPSRSRSRSRSSCG